MEYYYIINRKCFRGKLPIDDEILNTESKYYEWRSKLKSIYVSKVDLLDLEIDLMKREKYLTPNTPLDFTTYILQN